MRILIKGGLLVDGTGAPAVVGDVLVEQDRIIHVGGSYEGNYDQCINAQNRVVAPGFIDTHSHSDLQVLLEPHVPPKVRQGVTTEVLGQDGISMAPLPLHNISSWRKNLAGLEGDSEEIDWKYETTEGYLQLLENSGVGLNECYLVPHGNVRMEAMGLDNRPPTSQELQCMCDIVSREMESGAYGLSTGLIYTPCAYAQTEELIALCRTVAKKDGVFVVHQRSEADAILESMQEVLAIGRASGVRIHFSHFKVCGKKNWGTIEAVLALLDEAKAEGLHVSFDQYPYVAGSTMLGVILPPWAHDGGTDRLLKRLAEPALRKIMVRDMEHGLPGWDNFIDFAGLDQIFVTSVKTPKNENVIGKNLVEIGRMHGKDPYEAVFDLLLQEENAVGMVDFYGTEEHVKTFLNRPEQNVCTDGLLSGKPHPRVFGAFPRVLGKYVREENVLSLEAAIRKMTAKPAEVFGLKQRGLLCEGYYADIVVFDPATIKDKGDYVNPSQYPEGIDHVLVNGVLAVSKDRQEEALPGRVLRKGR